MIERKFSPEAVIIANGDYPKTDELVRILNTHPYVVCCDGAADQYLLQMGKPNVIIGDGDSLSEVNKLKYADILHIVADQETNDLTKAIYHLINRGVKSVAIFGATGKREDHTMGNISLLMDYKRLGLDVRCITDYGVFIPVCGPEVFESKIGQQVSIFNFGAKFYNNEGLVYNLYDFKSLWQGTLNEATSPQFKISADGEYLVFLES